MKKFLSYLPLNLNLGLLFLRLIIGILMAFYGYHKLINFEAMAASDFWLKNVVFLGFTGKIPLALVIFAELFCSLLLIFGFLTRLCLIPLLICMGYIFGVIAQMQIITTSENGTEINDGFVYFVIFLALFFTGPGTYSLDYLINRRK